MILILLWCGPYCVFVVISWQSHLALYLPVVVMFLHTSLTFLQVSYPCSPYSSGLITPSKFPLPASHTSFRLRRGVFRSLETFPSLLGWAAHSAFQMPPTHPPLRTHGTLDREVLKTRNWTRNISEVCLCSMGQLTQPSIKDKTLETKLRSVVFGAGGEGRWFTTTGHKGTFQGLGIFYILFMMAALLTMYT